MPLEAPLDPPAKRATELNRRFAHHAAAEVLAHALHDPEMGNAALVSSFGGEAIVLLHMLSVVDRTTPVLFVDTEMLFP
ncbi:MAG: phosphoadenylyl-sulfate reductase, partial [Boseongicola sp. SB0670_bin_30]|nr:phosphoadenylyl-sulfate reductase [Boseongicola sp. SB0670_bin_30]